MVRYIYIVLGILSITLGILGFVVPALPRTPFFLLAAYLFSKGSPYLHNKLMNNKLIGPYIHRVNNGLSLKARLISIAFMWCMISITVFTVFKHNKTMQYVMVALGIIGTIMQFIFLRKKETPTSVKPTATTIDKESSNICK